MSSPIGSSTWRSAALLCVLWGAVASAGEREGVYAPYPQPGSGYVTDVADVLTDAEEERIERWLWQVEGRTRKEIIVVVIESMGDYPGTASGSIEAFAQGLFDTYRIGNMPANDGVLLLVSVGDRKARIQLGAGYAGVRDAEAEAIMSGMILPAFRSGDFAGGITAGVREIARRLAGTTIGFPWRLVGMIGGVVALTLIGISLLLNGKRGWGWVFLGLAIVLLLAALWVLITLLRAMPRTRSRGWASGGQGGFGGGFSGGGGATGSW